MGLENLKSAFSDLIQTTSVDGRHQESPTTTELFVPSGTTHGLAAGTMQTMGR